jgi:class 3 adenylate cyclase
MTQQDLNSTLDTPYPLKQKFLKIILPGFVLISLVIAIVISQGGSLLIQKFYLRISENRSAVIDRALNAEAPYAWKQLQTTTQPKQVFQTQKGAVLLISMRNEVKELGLSHLKIYGKNALILYSSNEYQIGTYDLSPGYKKAVKGKRSLIEKQTDSGALYELYVKVPNTSYGTVMELYEPVNYLDKITLSVMIPVIGFLFAILIVLGWLMKILVFHAQKDINYRTHLIFEYRNRLQQLVSREAADTLRSATGKSDIVPKRVIVTVLFSDIRGFTDYCENESPETVVSFLNQLLSIIIETIEQNQGDIDKIIGDAVLAFFQGENAQANALVAAKETMKKLARKKFPRSVGIGIYTGVAVIGTIGASNRKDFTLIGDTVNIASRLCSAAQENEIVIDTASCQAARMEETNTEKLRVKGKEKAIDVCRIIGN